MILSGSHAGLNDNTSVTRCIIPRQIRIGNSILLTGIRSVAISLRSMVVYR